MTPNEYQSARKALGYEVPEWLEKLGIARDTHKKYNSGHAVIQPQVANHIETLLEYHKLRQSMEKALG